MPRSLPDGKGRWRVQVGTRGAGPAAPGAPGRPPAPAENPWQVLSMTAVGAFMTPFDASVVSVALPQIGASLHLSLIDGLWVQTAYLLVVTTALIPLGRLSDRLGRLRLYRVGVVVFALSSLLAALSWSGTALIVARCLQAAGGAVLSANASAIVTAAFPRSQRGRAIGLNATCTYLGLATGPVLGGILTQHLGWRSIFFVNLPVAAATLLLGSRLREESRPAGARGGPGLQFQDTLVFTAAVVAVLMGLTAGPLDGWGAPLTLALLGGGLVLLAVFVALEVRLASPLLDLDLFRDNRVFAAANLAALANFVAVTAVTVLTAVFLEVVEGRSAQTAGLLLAAQALVVVALASTAGRLSDRMGSRLLSTGGMVLIAASLAGLATLPAHAAVWRLEAILVLAGLGTAAFSSPNTSSVMGSVDRGRLGVASGTLGTMRFLGQSLSVAILGAVATSSLGPTGQRLILSGHAAAGAAGRYVTGYHLAMAVAAVVALAGAAASLARGPGTEPTSGGRAPRPGDLGGRAAGRPAARQRG